MNATFHKVLQAGNLSKRIKLNFCSLCNHINKESRPHVPVMVKEVVDAFRPKNNQIFLDMTFGAGGHSKELLKLNPNIKILALDRDPLAHKYAQELSKDYPQITPLLGRFSEIPQLLKSHNIKQNSLDGILFDFGCSSMQFDIADRGFSVSKNGPLDMRMDGERFPDMPTAADVLAFSTEEELAKILKVSRSTFFTIYQFNPLRSFVGAVRNVNKIFILNFIALAYVRKKKNK